MILAALAELASHLTNADVRMVTAIHASPERKWNLLDLAREAHDSISLLDERFREVVGVAPIRYITGWRMHLAKDLLRSSDRGIAAIAHRVGYDSEEIFSRAFKRDGTGPQFLAAHSLSGRVCGTRTAEQQ